VRITTETNEAPVEGKRDMASLPQEQARPSTLLAWCALVIALGATAGSLWLSIGMKLKACPLCVYQRTFVMGAAGVLLMALVTPARRSGAVSLLALPLAIAGLGVAGFHVYLEWTGKLECPLGIPLGIEALGSGPRQSLAVLAVLVLVLLIDALRRSRFSAMSELILALTLGALFAVGSIASAPPGKSPPTKPYDPEKEKLDECRPPYRAPDKEHPDHPR
jgi:hypothetical protein